jgi:ABC-type nitrate/sulfonate/bicarbonate transport system permease component
MRTTFWERTLPSLSVVVVLGIWQAYVEINDIPPIYLPAPLAIFQTLGEMIGDGSLFPHLFATLLRIFGGFLIASAFGILGGLLMGMSRLTRKIADPWIAALYPLPKISLIPLLVIWLGTGESYKIVISAITAFFPILMSTYAGVQQVDRGLIKAAEDLGASRRQVQTRVILPAAVPTIVAGLQLGMGVTIILVIAAEMIGGTSSLGLGGLLINAGQILETEKVFALLIVLALLGAAIMKGQEHIARRAMPWAL